jgi:hypothetical protein
LQKQAADELLVPQKPFGFVVHSASALQDPTAQVVVRGSRDGQGRASDRCIEYPSHVTKPLGLPLASSDGLPLRHSGIFGGAAFSLAASRGAAAAGLPVPPSLFDELHADKAGPSTSSRREHDTTSFGGTMGETCPFIA